MSSAAYALGRFAAWSYLPDYATAQCLRLYHRFLPSPPRPGTAQYALHYRIAFACVVLLFLSYNLAEAMRALPPNLYEVLGVRPDADEHALKSAFRAFARRAHPDRVGPAGEGRFVQVRDAFEALRDPVRRFAYDRFGPEALTWSHCATVREYLRHGLMQASGFYIVSGVFLLFLSAVGKPSPVAFWRYLLLLSLFASELSFLLGPSPSPTSSSHSHSHSLFLFLDDPASSSHSQGILARLFPRRVAYQHVLFLHQLFLFCSVALSRVAPVVFPQGAEVGEAVAERVRGAARMLDREVAGLIDKEFRTLQNVRGDAGRDEVVGLLTREMEDMIVESRLRREVEAGPLRTVWEAAVRRGEARARTAPPEVGAGSGRTRVPSAATVPSIPTAAASVHASPSLPSPPGSVSPVEKKVKLEEGEGESRLGAGRLPSPRPSPEPAWSRSSPVRQPVRVASFVRGRSVSY